MKKNAEGISFLKEVIKKLNGIKEDAESKKSMLTLPDSIKSINLLNDTIRKAQRPASVSESKIV